jgi:molybdate transport system substrate-binding protein
MSIVFRRPLNGSRDLGRFAALALVGALFTTLAAAAPAHPPPGAAPGPEIMVYAAASLREALESLTPQCQSESGARLVFSFGASSDLARQIDAANKADVFFSADEASMDALAKEDLVDTGSRRSPLSNRLVVIAPRDSSLHVAAPADLAAIGVRRLSIANPDSVPAGKYARAWLEKAGVWNLVRDRVVPGVDVRAALAVVEAGAADAGIVYSTDAAIARHVRVLYEVSGSDAPRISYAVAALTGRPRLDLARRVAACFAGTSAAPTFSRLGFITAVVTP